MSDMEQRLAALENRVGELEDINAIRRLHWAYGYYIDFNLPDEVADLFAEDGVVVFLSGEYVGRAGVKRLYGDWIHELDRSVGRILDTLRLMGSGHWLTFQALTRDCTVSMEVVGRFLALLELYKAQAVETLQEEALGELSVSWTGLDVDPAVVAATNWD